MPLIQYAAIAFGLAASACLWALSLKVFRAGRLPRKDASVAHALALTFAAQAYAASCTTAIVARDTFGPSLFSDDLIAAIHFTTILAACLSTVVMLALFRQLEDYP